MIKKIKVLVVDDSAFMRKAVEIMLSDSEDIEIVATGVNGREAILKNKEFSPDVITLDIEMPVMDGLSALKVIMKENPVPVIMLSSLTTEGADITMEALSIGAVDFIAKQTSFVSLQITEIKEDLIAKIRYFAKNKASLMRKMAFERIKKNFSDSISEDIVEKKIEVEPIVKTTQNIEAKPLFQNLNNLAHKSSSISIKNNTEIVFIGASTGGPMALQSVIPKLPANFPLPVIVVQHMPPSFTLSLANRLNNLSQLAVVEAKDGERMEKGKVYIAQGGRNLMIKSRNIISINDNVTEYLYKPSVDVSLNSIQEYYGGRVLAVIMTGMGSDGSTALDNLKKRGGFVIGQNEETCVIYGMPKRPNEKGISNIIVPLEKIADEIVKNL